MLQGVIISLIILLLKLKKIIVPFKRYLCLLMYYVCFFPFRVQYWEWKESQYPCYRVGNNSWYCFDWFVVVDHMETHCHWTRKSLFDWFILSRIAFWLVYSILSWFLIGFVSCCFSIGHLYRKIVIVIWYWKQLLNPIGWFKNSFVNKLIFVQMCVNNSKKSIKLIVPDYFFFFFRINWNIENLRTIEWNRNGRR